MVSSGKKGKFLSNHRLNREFYLTVMGPSIMRVTTRFSLFSNFRKLFSPVSHSGMWKRPRSDFRKRKSTHRARIGSNLPTGAGFELRNSFYFHFRTTRPKRHSSPERIGSFSVGFWRENSKPSPLLSLRWDASASGSGELFWTWWSRRTFRSCIFSRTNSQHFLLRTRVPNRAKTV